jgi:hypothetical protein
MAERLAECLTGSFLSDNDCLEPPEFRARKPRPSKRDRYSGIAHLGGRLQPSSRRLFDRDIPELATSTLCPETQFFNGLLFIFNGLLFIFNGLLFNSLLGPAPACPYLVGLGSFGIPRTRSETMLRSTSSVPPAIRIPGTPST